MSRIDFDITHRMVIMWENENSFLYYKQLKFSEYVD